MAGLREGCLTFFRLSPVNDAAAQQQLFGITRGEYEGRLDVQFYLPKHRELERRLHSCSFPVHRVGSAEISRQVVDGPFGSDLKVDEYVPTGVPLVRVSNCRTGQVQVDDELVFITGEKHAELIRSEVLPGDVLLTKAGSLGYSAVFPKELKRGNITSHLASIRPTEGVEPRYLSEFLSSSIGVQQIYRWGNKSTRPELNTDEVRAIEVVLPPPRRQQELVAAMDAARAQRQAKLAEADALLAGLDGFLLASLGLTPPPKEERKVFAIEYKALQGRFDPKTYLYRQHTTEKTFPYASLGSLTIKEPDYGSGSRAIERTSDEQPKYIRITDFRDDGIRPGHEFVTAETIEPECTLQDGDVLFARSGATAGKTFIYTQDIGLAVFAGYCIRFRFDETRVLPRFIYYFTKTTAYRQWVATIQRPSGQPNINKPEFKSFELPVPPLDAQRMIVERLNAERKKVESLRVEAEAGWQTAKRWFEEQLLGGAK